MIIVAIFVVHWQVSVFFQSFFLHRYGAHKQFEMSKGWERFFHVCTYLAQGPSFLSSRGYAILHRMHHAYSDTAKDPHSPENHRNFVSMMLATKATYDGYAYRRVAPEARFEANVPDWPLLDRVSQNWAMRGLWMASFVALYAALAPSPYFFLLVPLHWVMGPLHGSIVNWCGHRYGYRNFDNGDVSRNSLPFDFLTAGELLQNNHHKFAMSPTFAARWFEVDTTYLVMRVFAAMGIITMNTTQKARYPAGADHVGAQ